MKLIGILLIYSISLSDDNTILKWDPDSLEVKHPFK